MNGLLLDTSAIIAAERQLIDLGAITAGRQDLCFLSTVTAAELLHGVYRADTPQRQAARSTVVEAVLAAFPILELDLDTARAAAKLWADLQASGKTVAAHDLWLAASAVAHTLTVVTMNPRHFALVRGLRVESWASPSPKGTSGKGRRPRVNPAIPPSD